MIIKTKLGEEKVEVGNTWVTVFLPANQTTTSQPFESSKGSMVDRAKEMIDEVRGCKSDSTRHKSKNGETHTNFAQDTESMYLEMFNELVYPLTHGECSNLRSNFTEKNRKEQEVIKQWESNPSEKPAGKKETEGKLYYELSWEFIEAMAKRMDNNKGDKYPRYNWKKYIDPEELKQAINRHHIEVMKGNYNDGEEFLGHIVSYATNSMMLWEQLNNKK